MAKCDPLNGLVDGLVFDDPAGQSKPLTLVRQSSNYSNTGHMAIVSRFPAWSSNLSTLHPRPSI
ncbi:hypothetical protein BFJ70_g16436 [Fusarium oxysporum]|nr:hypothetical protein BFJ70_g16436 [Fusarium oxysporum]